MGIVTPDYRDVTLDQRRSSAIVPADTYARQPPDDEMRTKNAEQLSKALSSLGSSIENVTGHIAQQQQQQQEKEDLMQTDYIAGQVRQELRDGVPVEAQANPLLADKSIAVRGRVYETLGHQDGQTWAGGMYEQFLQSEDWKDPAKTHAFINNMRNQAAEHTKGQPFYGGSYMKAVDHFGNQIEQHAQAQRSHWYTQMQIQGFKDEVAEKAKSMVTPDPSMQPPAAPEGTKWVTDPVSHKVVLVDTKSGAVVAQSKADEVKKNTPAFVAIHGANGNAIPLIAKFEGFRSSPYWDVNHYRVGFGSDTITTKDGKVIEVKPGMTVDRTAAMQDLQRRVGEFQTGIVSRIGQDAWKKLGPNAQAALTSFAYNYGMEWDQKVKSVASAARAGDPVALAHAIAAQSGANGGVNAKRRQTEAQVALGNADPVPHIQNEIRNVDKVWSSSSGIDNYMRRQAMAEQLIKMASETGDSRYLDAMPKELMTPALEAEFTKARRQAENIQWSNYEHQKRLENEAEEKLSDGLVENMMQKIAKGEEISFNDAMRPDGRMDEKAFKFADTHRNTMNIPEAISVVNKENLSDAIESAAVTKDWSKAMPGVEGEPTPAQIRRMIATRNDLRTEEKRALISSLDKIMSIGYITSSPDARNSFSPVKVVADQYSGNSILQTMNKFGASINWRTEAQDHYQREVRQRIKAWIEDNNGSSPSATVKKEIFDIAAEKTTQHLDKLAERIQKFHDKNPKETVAKEEANVVSEKDVPKDAPRVSRGGVEYVPVEENGKVVLKKVNKAN